MCRCLRALAVATALGSGMLLAGCTASTPAPVPTSTLSQQTPGASQTPVPPAPRLDPAGTAQENFPYFNFVNERLFSANPGAKGQAIIDNLVAAGFDKAAMQVTPDTTVTRARSDSIQFSVAFDGSCLIGQTDGTDYEGIIGQPLGNGACLIGKTRPINW